MRVNPEGHTCRCGAQGCWETEVGYAALHRAAGPRFQDVALPGLVDAVRNGDPDAQAAFSSVSDWLGIGLCNLVNTFNPQCIVLGGHLGVVYAVAGDRVMAHLDEALPAARELVRVEPSQLGGDAPLVGAAEFAFMEVLEDPTGMLRRSAAS